MNQLPNNLDNLTEISKNQRFAKYYATLNDTGEEVFVKQVINPKLEYRLRREVYGLEKMAQLAQAHSFPFIIPRIIQNGQDYLITSWAKGNTMKFSPGLPDLLERVDFMTTSFAAMDMATQLVNPGQTNFAHKNNNGQNIVQHIEASLGKLDLSGYFDPALIDQSVKYLKKHAPLLVGQFSHADFVPSNIIEASASRTLVDWESASQLWPRFYDLVNFTHNKSLDQPDLTTNLKELVNRYFETIKSSPEQNIQQLNTIAAARALSSIIEYMNEPDEFHNTKQAMDPRSAAHVAATLERIIAQKLYIN